MRTISAFGALLLCGAISPVGAQISVSSSDGSAPYGYPATFDFNSPTAEYDGTIFTTSSGIRAQPAGSTGGFGSVGPTFDNDAGPTTLDLSAFGDIGSITFLWGSVDTYNMLEVLDASSTPIFTLNGGDFGVAPADGNQTAASSNRLVTLTFAGTSRGDVTGLRFSSTRDAFEFDNVTVLAAPEPATWMMTIAGFGALGGALRRKRAVAFA